MYELWRDDNFDIAAFDGLRSRVNQLTWSTLLLRVGSGLREQEMLGHGLTSDTTRPNTNERTWARSAPLDRPKIPSR
jgi:hypothetical protein